MLSCSRPRMHCFGALAAGSGMPTARLFAAIGSSKKKRKCSLSIKSVLLCAVVYSDRAFPDLRLTLHFSVENDEVRVYVKQRKPVQDLSGWENLVRYQVLFARCFLCCRQHEEFYHATKIISRCICHKIWQTKCARAYFPRNAMHGMLLHFESNICYFSSNAHLHCRIEKTRHSWLRLSFSSNRSKKWKKNRFTSI